MRGAHFTPAHQRAAGKARADTPEFLKHNQTVSPDGPAAQSAYHRAPKGSRLLDCWHIEFLFLGDLGRDIDLSKQPSEEERRLLYGYYVWGAIWGNLNTPARPTADEFLTRSLCARTVIGRGLPLPDPLDVIFVAPDDFSNDRGQPLSRRKQRKAFREAMVRGRAAAEAWSMEVARQAEAQAKRPRATGQRLPAATSQPTFVTRTSPSRKYRHRRRTV